MTRIVLGHDGSDFAVQALEWALDEAELRKLPLVVAHAWQWPYGAAEPEARAQLRKAAEHVLWHGADCARSTSLDVTVGTDLYEGSAAHRLVELSADAALVVVGSRGLGALPGAVVGSVAGHVAVHAECPVIVVRGPLPAAGSTRPIVVADSEPDAPVLEFAFAEAALRRLPVTAAGPAVRHQGVPVRTADPREGATLMVVGRTGAASLLRRATCPVAVVADRADARRG
ncbi:universal stress protein [Nonomuraea terrae]|uniref:universal stress protein n=1 Tax=Nonomuraea terrae TaxID=2530383 RepID=UPI0037B7DC73